MIAHPNSEYLEQIKEIWSLCFGDKKETVDFFFETCYSSDNCYVYILDNRAVATLQMIPCIIVDGEERYSAKYMYAVCTHPDFQGRGIMSDLITASLEAEKKNGTKAILCIPDSKSLFDFYKRFGFTDKIYSSVSVINRHQAENNAIKNNYFLNTDISSFNRKRNEILHSGCFVSFPDEYMKLCDGFDYLFSYNESFYAVFSEDDDYIKVSDCGWFGEHGLNEMLYCIFNESEKNRAVIEFNGDKNDKLNGVIKYLDDEFELFNKLYLGIKME